MLCGCRERIDDTQLIGLSLVFGVQVLTKQALNLACGRGIRGFWRTIP
jgi:hypothetical protein